MARLVTFKYNHDSQSDYKSIAVRLFEDNKCIVSAVEKGKNGDNHVHFIGYTSLPEGDYTTVYEAIKKEHPWHTQVQSDGTPRYSKAQLNQVMRKSSKEVTQLGFQYVMKTSAVPEYSQGFEEGELDDLKEASDEHVKKLKDGPKELVHAKKYAGTAKEVFFKIRLDVSRYMKENNVPLRPQFKRNCLWIMFTHPDCTSEWEAFFVENA